MARLSVGLQAAAGGGAAPPAQDVAPLPSASQAPSLRGKLTDSTEGFVCVCERQRDEDLYLASAALPVQAPGRVALSPALLRVAGTFSEWLHPPREERPLMSYLDDRQRILTVPPPRAEKEPRSQAAVASVLPTEASALPSWLPCS